MLLRYFERKSAREIAQTLGTSEEAAQKRANRALERLRELLANRGVVAGASGLVVVISANAVQAAPAGLALSISTSAALAATAVATVTTSTDATRTLAMTTLQKTLVATTLAVAIGVGTYQARQASRLRAQVRTLEHPPAPGPGPFQEAAFRSLQDKVKSLEAQNGELAGALARASASQARLEAEREQARRSAVLFKELADQANQDESKLSPEEKTANEAARMRVIEEVPKLAKALSQFDKDKSSGADSPAEDTQDDLACLLYGALNLDEQQFGQVYGLMQKYTQAAKQKGLSEENPTPESAAVFEQMMERCKADIQGLLTPEQARVFAAILPLVQFEPGRLSFNYKFDHF